MQQFFAAADVQRWDAGRFAMVRTIQDAPRNQGQVHHMVDSFTRANVAVKQMKNEWVCDSHAAFAAVYPHETERPWVDIGCNAFLTSVAYPYVCPLLGVYRDAERTSVVTELASEGDLFTWAMACDSEPGLEREAAVRPLALQILDAVRMLHDLNIVHGDISAENILLSRRATDGELQIQLIDFGMSSVVRFAHVDRGKPTYQAPEVHSGEAFDGFLSDAFAVGVALYGLLMLAYPWNSTKPDSCKAFEFLKKSGFRALVAKRRCLNRSGSVGQRMSEPLIQLLQGLLAVDPADRLTLGECAIFAGGDGHPAARSAWQEPWVQGVFQ